MLKTVRSTVNVDQITGVLPVVNGGTGVTTSTGTGSVVLSAAPTLSGNVGLSTGNIVPATAAKGINFTANTPAAGMTSQLLNWYEEGTWTPVLRDGAYGNAATGTFIGRYTRIGNQVSLFCNLLAINTTGLTSTNGIYITGLPFIPVIIANLDYVCSVQPSNMATTAGSLSGYLPGGFDYILIVNGTTTGNSLALVAQITSGASDIRLNITYRV